MAVMLEPRDFGVVALAGVPVYFLLMLVGHSFSDALVQREAIDREHIDTAFWATTGLGLLSVAACAAMADPLSAMLGEPEIAQALLALALILPVNALAAVPSGLFRRALRFRVLAACTVSGRAAGAAVGIVAAFAGFGMWSLVAQQLVGALVTAGAVLAAPDWRPGLRVRRRHLGAMGGFGFYVSMSQCASGAAQQLLTFRVGHLFGHADLGSFNLPRRRV